MSNKKNDHTGFRNGDLFCFNCGSSQPLSFPMPVGMAADFMKSFSKHHRNCPKTWQEPKADPNGKTEKENMDWWLTNGEQGLSSKTIFKHLGGINLNGKWGDVTPSDPDDFRRCYLLIKAIPQWKEKLHLMKPVSQVWSSLVDHWDELTQMLETAMKTPKQEAPEMYALMKKIGC